MGKYRGNIPDLSHIKTEVKAEFRGLFYGEGCVFVEQIKYGRYKDDVPLLRPHITMALRDDDKAAIDYIYNLFSFGSIYEVKYRSMPNIQKTVKRNNQWRWQIRSFNQIKAIIEQVLLPSIIPCKKIKDLELMLAFCDFRLSLPYRMGRDHRKSLLEWLPRFKAIKQYSLPKG